MFQDHIHSKNLIKMGNSPKCKFRAQINYLEPLKGIGSVSSATANTIEDVKHKTQFYINQAKRSNVKCHVQITESTLTYPDFNWVTIENYEA